VGKVFKPALRWDAARRAVTRMLAGLRRDGGEIGVDVGPHAEHGSLITVTIEGAPEDSRAELERQIDERLDPLVMKHEIVWR
jgi:fatty-acyl-CoA synthase